MSNVAATQCSSGVESGWTLYLDDEDKNEFSASAEQSGRNPRSYRSGRSQKEEDKDDDDESLSLSMVSDASSGPPSYEVEDWSCHISGGGFLAGSEQSGKKKSKRQRSRGRHSHYEDTACSRQNFSLSNNHAPRRHALDFPQGCLIANLEDKYEYGNHCRYLQAPEADQEAASKKSGHSGKLM